MVLIVMKWMNVFLHTGTREFRCSLWEEKQKSNFLCSVTRKKSRAFALMRGEGLYRDAAYLAGTWWPVVTVDFLPTWHYTHHHSTSALVSEILTSVLQTVQKNKTIYIWTVHIYRLYRRQCAKYTYIYSVHTVYYKDILSYQYTLYTICTRLHYVHIYT